MLRDPNIAYRIGFVVKCVTEAFLAVTRAAKMGGMYATLGPYLLYHMKKGRFVALETRDAGFAPQSQRSAFAKNDTALYVEDGVHPDAWGRSDELDTACRYLATKMLSTLTGLLQTQALYTVGEEKLQDLPLLKALDTSGSTLPPLFSTIPDAIASSLQIDKPPRSVTLVIPPDASGSNVMGQNPDAPMPDTSSAVSVKEEDVLDLTIPTGRRELTESERGSYKLLCDALKKYVHVYDTCFRDIEEIHSHRTGDHLSGNVDLLLTDPPYNIRRERDRENSSYDELSLKDMDDFCSVATDLLCEGAHGHIFCSYQQIMDWESRLDTASVSVNSPGGGDDDIDGEDRQMRNSPTSRTVPVFNVDTIPLHYTRAPGVYRNNPMMRKISHTAVDEYAVHFWRKGSTFEQCMARVDYKCGFETPSSYPRYTNEMNNIPRLPHKEKVFANSSRDASSRKKMARPEQKNVSLLRDIIRKFTKPGMLVVDTFAGTLSVAKACLSLEEHRKAVLCDKDPDVIRDSFESLVAVFASQVLNVISDIVEPEEVRSAAKTFLAGYEALQTQSRVDAGQAPPEYPPFQSLPDYILEFLRGFHGEPRFVQAVQGMPLHKWPRNLESLYHTTDQVSLLAHEMSVRKVYRAPSLIKHPKAGFGLFAGRAFTKGEIIGFYYGTLIYADMDLPSHRHRIIGYGVLQVNRERFNHFGLDLIDEGGDPEGVRKMWIVPGVGCAMAYINDPRYLDDEQLPPLKDRRTANVEFVQNIRTLRPRDVSTHKAMVAKATTDISAGEEFYINYGSEYSAWN